MYMKTQTKSYCCKALTDASTGLYGRCAYQEMKTRNKKKRVLSRTKHSLGVLAFEEPESAGTSKFIPFRCPLYLTNCGAWFYLVPLTLIPILSFFGLKTVCYGISVSHEVPRLEFALKKPGLFFLRIAPVCYE